MIRLLLAGLFVACSTGPQAYSNVLPELDSGSAAQSTASVSRITGKDGGLPGAFNRPLAAAFDLRWNVDAGPEGAAARRPIVHFAWANAKVGDGAPLDRLVRDASIAMRGWSEGSFPAYVDHQARAESCLARALYFEARGENRRGQLAVAQVILNRVKSRLYPNDICGVVYQNADERHRCQFSFACDGRSDRPANPAAWREAMVLAHKALASPDGVVFAEVGNSTHYHATYVKPRWAGHMKVVDVIGHHVFYASNSNPG